MPVVKKKNPISFSVIDESKAMCALEIYAYTVNNTSMVVDPLERKNHETRLDDFKKQYGHPWQDTIKEIWSWCKYMAHPTSTIEQIYQNHVDCVSRVEIEPLQAAGVSDSFEPIAFIWVFKGFMYEVDDSKNYTDEQIRLLILEDFDKERRYFEKLKAKFDEAQTGVPSYERPRIPEKVRIEVWRRDGGKCARCGSREKLEYDHIVPISKGGSNTARNIELLCEKHNRSKSNNVV